jgi:hypothetical protein
MPKSFRFKHVAISFVCGSFFFSGLAWAAPQQLHVSMDKVKLFLDGVDKTSKDGTYDNNGTKVPASFIYDGTTYVPIRMVGDMLGKPVTWDQACKAVVIGAAGASTEACKEADKIAAIPFLYMDASSLIAIKDMYKNGNKQVADEVNALAAAADKELQSGPYSVMNKTSTPPSGDKHDYTSIGIYWWPNPNTPDGKPYVQKDGYVNPESNNDTFDKSSLVKANSAIRTLTLAYYYTGKEAYAEYAAKLLKTWYLNPDTRMNPNLNFGQFIPGVNNGRKEGIIETLNIMNMLDSSLLLNQTPYLTDDDMKQFKGWIGDYLQWLMTSPIALQEKKAANNHGTWYDNQVAAYALFTGQTDLAKQVLGGVQNRIAAQIEPDGTMPLEMTRARSLHYPVYNLHGFYNLAMLGDRLGIDLWNYETTDGRSVRKALDFLTPYVSGDKQWDLKQVVKENFTEAVQLLVRSAAKYDDDTYLDAAKKLMNDVKDPREKLLYADLQN